jgi:Glycosyltransferases involved in cell wall biogenesis
MKFSIVIPCYNEEHNLPFLLSSIKKLNYPKEEFEVIVVDNNCTDRTVEIAKSFNVDKIVQEKNQGLTWARQRGFLVSDGQIIYDVDADVS